MSAKVTIRPAKADDFLRFTGNTPPYRNHAWVGELDGQILGMGGICYPPGATVPVMWADFSEEGRRHAVTLHRAGREVLARFTARYRRLACVADATVPASRRWLERLGFTATGLHSDTGEVYIYDRDRHQDQRRDVA